MTALARAFTAGALVLAVALVALLLFRSEDGYRVALLLESASQLVDGNQVKVGGVPVGTVRSIELSPDFRARVEIDVHDDELTPLHRGTRAEVRFDSLTGIAGRYIALTPGPSNLPAVPDGGELSADETRAAVDPDQVLSTLDPKTQRDLRAILRRGPRIFEGRAARQANAGLEALNPALSQGTALARELARDERALARLVDESADVVSQLASRPADLEQLTGNALAALGAIAERSAALESSIAQLPPTLRRTNTSLVNLRATLRELRPLVRETRPAARPLADVLTKLQPVARRGRPVVARLRELVRRPGRTNDLLDALRGILPVERQAVPAFRSTAQVLRDAAPVVTEARPYAPDVAGFIRGLAGTTAGYYDANGRYTRISAQASLFTLTGPGSLVPLGQLDGLTGLRRGVESRCPGAATQTLPDGSNPYFEVPGTCDPGDNPR